MAELTAAQEIRIARGKTWIDDNAAKPPEEIAGQMRERCDTFLEEIDGLSETQLSFVEGEGKWTIRQVSLHVLHAIPRVGLLVPLLAGGAQPPPAKPRPGVLAEDPGSFDAIVSQLRGDFDTVVEVVESVTASPDLGPKAEHPFFGQLNCLEWFAFNVLHITVHVAQVQRIKANAKFPN